MEHRLHSAEQLLRIRTQQICLDELEAFIPEQVRKVVLLDPARIIIEKRIRSPDLVSVFKEPLREV